MQNNPATLISTARVRDLLAGSAPPWLVFAPDRAAFADGHIPGSLTATDDQLLAALPGQAMLVIYGEDSSAERARSLAAKLAATGRDVRWYPGGLHAWAAAGLPVEGSSAPGGPA